MVVKLNASEVDREVRKIEIGLIIDCETLGVNDRGQCSLKNPPL